MASTVRHNSLASVARASGLCGRWHFSSAAAALYRIAGVPTVGCWVLNGVRPPLSPLRNTSTSRIRAFLLPTVSLLY
jgi:hypothetical protein